MLSGNELKLRSNDVTQYTVVSVTVLHIVSQMHLLVYSRCCERMNFTP